MYLFSMIMVMDSWVYILVSKLVTLCTLYMYSFMYVNCISKKQCFTKLTELWEKFRYTTGFQ